jgi:methylated-DNA-[protein]-cysteine S-methyltransferase
MPGIWAARQEGGFTRTETLQTGIPDLGTENLGRSKALHEKDRLAQPLLMHYHLFSTRFGYTAILFEKPPLLIKRIFLPHPRRNVLEGHIQQTGPATAGHTQEVLSLCQDIQAYFDGAPIWPPWELLDLRGRTPLQGLVLKTVATVPHGTTRTYGQIAAQIGRPRACRFVGTTLARNPFPVVIPCHRIVRADGSPGSFSGGAELKRRMLALEERSQRCAQWGGAPTHHGKTRFPACKPQGNCSVLGTR